MDGKRGLRFSLVVSLLAALLAAPLAMAGSSAPAGAGSAKTGTAAKTVRVEPHYRVGETVLLRVEKTTQVDVNGQRASLQRTGFDVRLKVLAQDASGTRIECIYGRKELLDGTDQAIRDNPVLKAVIDSNEGLRVVLQAGPHMAQPHVGNVDEVLTAFGRTLDNAIAQMAPDVGAGVQRLSAQLMTRRDAFAAKLIEELLVYFAPVGVTVPLSGVLTGTHDLPPLVGDTPVKTWTSLGVDSYDRAAGRMKISYRQSSNPDAVRAQASDVIKSVISDAAAAGVPGANAAENPDASAATSAEAAQAVTEADRLLASLRVDDVATYDIDMKTGWPISSRYVHTVQAGDQRLSDETVVRLVKK